ncbi:MAG: hypothetical protein FJW30_01965 [Acidobacteria bacterium]|nr:hypothetical protein [Acidobacteriota bacterium]
MPGLLLPLFPLGVVLFPRTRLPLHIFEERYKKMIGDLMDTTREFGVVLTIDKGVASVGCTARITGVKKRYEDGRLDIETIGYRRFEISRLDEDEPFLTGQVDLFDDDETSGPADESLIQKAIRGYYAMRALESGRDLPEPDLNDSQLSFQLAQAITDVKVRQVVLMSRNEAARIRRLAEYFPATAAKERRVEEFKSIIPRNGHARLLPSS